MSKLSREMKTLAKHVGGSFKTVHDRIQNKPVTRHPRHSQPSRSGTVPACRMAVRSHFATYCIVLLKLVISLPYIVCDSPCSRYHFAHCIPQLNSCLCIFAVWLRSPRGFHD
ncbi:hypothetical protein B1H58_04625 [Pantoea alhagi]|uniref:Putative integrase N-terminal domain-containing protein n=1 Tax=Pantoea alhagi TaxID=1891675 RepID=A0A1W6B2R6_9GAMM|nr:hypothetical protein B1H58_04625 [Pantoea alhagi]